MTMCGAKICALKSDNYLLHLCERSPDQTGCTFSLLLARTCTRSFIHLFIFLKSKVLTVQLVYSD